MEHDFTGNDPNRDRFCTPNGDTTCSGINSVMDYFQVKLQSFRNQLFILTNIRFYQLSQVLTNGHAVQMQILQLISKVLKTSV